MTSADRLRKHIELLCKTQGMLSADAAKELLELGAQPDLVQAALASIDEEARQMERLDFPRGVNGWNYRHQISDVKRKAWYTGPVDYDRFWPDYLRVLEARVPGRAVADISQSSTKTVAQLTNPGARGIRKKGLVLGYVQSGKTANYAALIAKAADAGYRLVIVLAGIHNSLRRQTQVRLDADLGLTSGHIQWVPLTHRDADFGDVTNGAALASQKDLRLIAVVKKNVSRLENVKGWLEDIPLNVRRGLPALVIDDEADQATPNSKAAKDKVSRINELLREVLGLLPTSTYIGYTATPFANVLINPDDDLDLYPSDFIIDLPKPEGYFGAESLFGGPVDDDAEDPMDGLDMVRVIPPDDVPQITPPSRKEDRADHPYSIPPSLEQAMRWFVVASAIRRARGQHAHSSMLIHTTQLIEPQFTIADLVDRKVHEFQSTDAAFKVAFDKEARRVDGDQWQLPRVTWAETRKHISTVLEEIRVVVDNGASSDRLDYERLGVADDGAEKGLIETVIAVGGNTLSRGLTLEGLVVSYFCRRAGTYDALLQMGRWFGFRNGYEDLPRVWVTKELLNRFRFLSIVEQEIRDDVARYETEGLTPMDFAVRIRTHPSMAVTSQSKMYFANQLNVTYGGKRLQTFRFNHRDEATLQRNIQAVRELVGACKEQGLQEEPGFPESRIVIRDVPSALIKQFLMEYTFHEDHKQLDAEAMVRYLDDRHDVAASQWNVVIAGGGSRYRTVDGKQVDLGVIDLGASDPVNMINRARLESLDDSGSPQATADVKAVMSRQDRFIDFPVGEAPSPLPTDERQLARIREEKMGGRGVLIIYPISPDSTPMGRSRLVGSREDLGADAPVMGVGIIFPAVNDEDSSGEVEYVGLHVSGAEAEAYEEEEEFEASLLGDDNEADSSVDGDAILTGDQG